MPQRRSWEWALRIPPWQNPVTLKCCLPKKVFNYFYKQLLVKLLHLPHFLWSLTTQLLECSSLICPISLYFNIKLDLLRSMLQWHNIIFTLTTCAFVDDLQENSLLHILENSKLCFEKDCGCNTNLLSTAFTHVWCTITSSLLSTNPSVQIRFLGFVGTKAIL